jgi:transposase
MNNCTTVVGLDVHKATIVAAVLPPTHERPREVTTIENDPARIERLVNRLAGSGPLAFVYEAGPCGFEVQRQLTALGYACEVIAPGLTPVRPGDRVKTDRRDAEKLARLFRAGELTTIRIPTREEEGARDHVRTREAALVDRLRARHRLSKFLLRQGRFYREGRAWTLRHREWIRTQRFDFETLRRSFEATLRAMEDAEARLATLDEQLEDLAQREPYRELVRRLRCFKGVDTLSALTLTVEAQDFRRFKSASSFMSLTGLVPSEFSSGGTIRRGSITKAGNAHLRRILVEAAWAYSRRGVPGNKLSQRREGCSPAAVALGKKAEDRLHRKFSRMVSRNKMNQVAVVAVARELAGFVWAMGRLPD